MQTVLTGFLIGRFIGTFLPSTLGLDGYTLWEVGRVTGAWQEVAARAARLEAEAEAKCKAEEEEAAAAAAAAVEPGEVTVPAVACVGVGIAEAPALE